jgi:hypothetical protein
MTASRRAAAGDLRSGASLRSERLGEQSTFRVADINNPNLTDFAKAE